MTLASSPFTVDVEPNYEGLIDCFMQSKTPDRMYHMELFLDLEIQQELCDKFGLMADVDRNDPAYEMVMRQRTQLFTGQDFVPAYVRNLPMPMKRQQVTDTAAHKREGGRSFQDLHTGPITNWDEFEQYPWPDPAQADMMEFDRYTRELPDGMCIAARGMGHFCEHLCWLMGYETLCYALFDQRDLVRAIYEKQLALDKAKLHMMLQFDRVKITWASDDMGFRTGTLISPDDTREFVLEGHKQLAHISHAAGRPYVLHSCGNLESIMDDLIDDVKIDARHSYEDAILPVTDFHRQFGRRVGVIGGLDVDFLCRADEQAIRARARTTLDQCMPTGRYVLGSGNSIANYIPLDNYLAMLDEGRKWGK